MSNPSANPRASLLSALRTGGVRSAGVPQTAAPGGSFNIPRISSGLHLSTFPEEEDHVHDQQSVFATQPTHRIPMTAAVDGPGFAQQRGMNPNSAPFTPFMAQPPPQATQAFQMQMMQLELMKMQAQQQYQAQIIAQAQMQQMQSPRRVSFNPPATAGPLNTSFDLRSATLSAQMRRSAQTAEDQVPMTAGLDGKFGSRISRVDFNDVPATPNSTTVISGGTSLGSPASNNGTPSKSDSANWRRGGNNNSVLSGNNRSPSVKVTPPPADVAVPPSPAPLGKSRPQPLSFNVAAPVLPEVTIDTAEGENDDEDSSSSEKSGFNSDPTTPSSNGPPLSPREEAAKKLYEGLGIGRPVVPEQVALPARMASQPVRQPRGPPSGADELGPKNFATRIRRKAIGGLGMLMNSRERRELEFVEAY